MDNEIIDGGYILLSRQILKSDIWKKPPEYLKIFLYILLKVNHQNALYPRGCNFFNFSDEKPDGVSKNQIYEFLRWSKHPKVGILTTQKTTRGIIIQVNNYNKYQSSENYKSQDKKQNNSKTTPTQLQNNSNTINNNEIMKELNNNITSIGEKRKSKKNKKFIPPTLEEVKSYCIERDNNVDPQKFFDYYNVGNWVDSKGNAIKNWKQKMIAVWEKKKVKSTAPNNESFYMSLSRG